MTNTAMPEYRPMATPLIVQEYPAVALCTATPGRIGAIAHKRRKPDLLLDGE